jgi:hypothetical protein
LLHPPDTAEDHQENHEDPTLTTREAAAIGPRARSWAVDLKDDDPLSASIEMQRSQTIQRDAWQVRIQTAMRLSCTRDAFLLRASLRAWEGDSEVCHREWDESIPRDLA